MKKIAILMALTVVLAGCAGGDDAAEVFIDGEGGEAILAPATGAAVEVDVDELSYEPGNVDVRFDVADERKVIRRASLELEAGDTRDVFERIVALAEASGGFVADATVFPLEGDDEQPHVTLTLRIPADELGTTMSAIKDTADEVISESQSAADVTEEYVDLTARLTNLEALEVELRALLTEVRQQPDADPDKLLRVFNEISLVRGQIEQIRGQLNYLDNVVALASLDVQLVPTVVAPPIVDDGWQPVEVARESLTALVAGIQKVVDWAINFAVFVLPMLLLILGIPLAIGFYVYRRWRRKDSSKPGGPPVPAES